MVAAFEQGTEFAEPAVDPHTVAAGLRVPGAVGDFMILRAVRDSGGRAMAAEEERLLQWMQLAARSEGIALCPEAAACVGALGRAVAEGFVGTDERVVLFNTGAAQKYVEVLATDLPVVESGRPMDLAALSDRQ